MKSLQILMMGAKASTELVSFGLLYNKYVAADANLLPADWKLPDASDWNELFSVSDAKNSLRKVGSQYWNDTSATDLYGFGAVGAGMRVDNTGVYSLFKEEMWGYNDQAVIATTYVYVTTGYGNSTSIRPMWNGTGTPPSTVTDYDGNVYDVVQIGTQYWLAQNWKCTHLNDGTTIPLVEDDVAWGLLTTKAYCYPNGNESNV